MSVAFNLSPEVEATQEAEQLFMLTSTDDDLSILASVAVEVERVPELSEES